MYLLGSLFDGIGGFPLAATYHGIKPIWASEIEAAPMSVTKKHFPKMKHLGDITKISGHEIWPVDVITFGSPCQDLSIAGAGKGFGYECENCGHSWTYTNTYGTHEDFCPECFSENIKSTRSGLFLEAIRIIREMRDATCGIFPRFIAWENVPGALSSNGGADFRTVLEEIAEAEIPIPRSGKWASAGMVRSQSIEIAWRILDAQYWGVPQRRKRIFLVADFAGQRSSEILFKPEGLPGYLAESAATREGTAGSFAGGFGTTGILPFDTTQITSPQNGNRPEYGDPCHPLCAAAHVPAIVQKSIGFKANASIADNAPVINEGTPTLQTTSQMAVCAAFKQGNSAIAGGIGYEEEKSPTLTAGQSGTNLVPAVLAFQSSQSGIRVNATHATLDANNGSRRQNGVIAIQHSIIGRKPEAGAQGAGYRDDGKMLTLDSRGSAHCIAYGNEENNEVANTLLSKSNLSYRRDMDNLALAYNITFCDANGRRQDRPNGGLYITRTEKSGTVTSKTTGYETAIVNHYRVRRLTPVECARLQKFPDYWCQDLSDTQAYKCYGNSVAIPCVDFVLGGIAEVLKRGGCHR